MYPFIWNTYDEYERVFYYDRVTLNMKETNLKRLTQCLDLKRLTKYLDNKLRDKGEKGKEKKEEKR